MQTYALAPPLRLAPAPPAEPCALLDEDGELVSRAQRGDSQAFGLLFQRHHARVFSMCSRLLRDRAEVEDAVQQAFLEGWRSLPRFEGRSRFTTWITRIAIHTCLGFRRRLRRWFVTEEATWEETLAEPTPAQVGPEAIAGLRQRERALGQALDRLTAKKRVVFILSELEEMSAPEIAEILEIPEATVRTRLFHARRELMGYLRAHPRFVDLFPPVPEGQP